MGPLKLDIVRVSGYLKCGSTSTGFETSVDIQYFPDFIMKSTKLQRALHLGKIGCRN
jgi:hypothetical protein